MMFYASRRINPLSVLLKATPFAVASLRSSATSPTTLDEQLFTVLQMQINK